MILILETILTEFTVHLDEKWIDSGKRAKLTEYESKILSEIQQGDKRAKPVNEVKAFHRLYGYIKLLERVKITMRVLYDSCEFS